MNLKNVIFVGFAIFAVLFGVPFLYGSFYTVKSGNVGLEFTLGKLSDVTKEGLHFKIPFVTSVEKIDVRTKKTNAPAQAGTKDLQRVSAEVAVNYHLDVTKIKDIYSRFGLDVEEKIIGPRIQEITKAIVAKYAAEQLLSLRDEVKKGITDALILQLKQYYIIVEDVQITNFEFSEQFNNVIESKQVAEQNALKAKNDLERIKVEAEQKVASAKAEAEAIRIQAEAIQKQGGKEYVQLQAIAKWDGKLPTYNGSGAVPFVNIDK